MERPIIRRKAYFVVLTNIHTGEIACDIWSSTPWDQSRFPKDMIVGIYAENVGDTFQQALDGLVKDLAYRVVTGMPTWKKLTENWWYSSTNPRFEKEKEKWQQSLSRQSADNLSQAQPTLGNS